MLFIAQSLLPRTSQFRRALMATRLGVPVGTGPANATAEWAALELPRTAFGVVRNLTGEDGTGLIKPLWGGMTRM